MIEYGENNTIELTCNICGNSVTGFDDFQEAVDYKKDNGWKSTRYRGDWEDICPMCQRGGK